MRKRALRPSWTMPLPWKFHRLPEILFPLQVVCQLTQGSRQVPAAQQLQCLGIEDRSVSRYSFPALQFLNGFQHLLLTVFWRGSVLEVIPRGDYELIFISSCFIDYRTKKNYR